MGSRGGGLGVKGLGHGWWDQEVGSGGWGLALMGIKEWGSRGSES